MNYYMYPLLFVTSAVVAFGLSYILDKKEPGSGYGGVTEVLVVAPARVIAYVSWLAMIVFFIESLIEGAQIIFG